MARQAEDRDLCLQQYIKKKTAAAGSAETYAGHCRRPWFSLSAKVSASAERD